MTTIDLSIVIPVYNSEKILAQLLQRLAPALERIEGVSRYELILVDDFSPDDSWSVITELCAQYAWVRGIRLRKNAGQHGAIMAGLREAQGRVVVSMDDDLQHAPEDIQLLYREVRNGCDVCYAEFREKHHAFWKVLGSRFNDWTAQLLIEKPRGLSLSSFKAMSLEVVREIGKYEGPYVYIDGLLLSVTRSVKNVQVPHHARFEGKGNYGFFSSIFLWTKMATNFSVLPLRLASFLGLLFSAAGLLVALYLVWARLREDIAEVPGWTSLVVVVLIVGGIQLLALGAIGEYLGRAYVCLNRKPQYVVRDRQGF